MKTFTINDIRCWNPCYDPTRYLPADWQGTALDILDCEDCPAIDRLWVVIREECIDARTLRLFAMWCARQALALIDDPDQRSVAALDTAERFANGEATVNELAAAGDAAWYATRAAAKDAAKDAARDAARAAAWAAAGDAVSAAAREAARAAAWAATKEAAWYASGAARAAAKAAAKDAARDAAWDAANAAAWDAAGAAWYATKDAASGVAWAAANAAAIAAQVGHLHEMLLVTDAAQF